MAVRLTNIGKVLLGVLVMLYLAALSSQSSLLLLLVGIVLGCFAVNLLSARRIVNALELRSPGSVCLSEGQRMSEPWSVLNRRSNNACLVEAESDAGLLFRFGALGPIQEIRLTPNLVYQKRGVFSLSQVRLCSIYPFGLVRVARKARLPGEVVVGPAVYETVPPRAAGHDVMVGGRQKGHRRSTSGADFAGVRPAQPGDPMKQIHWRSSAKGQGLMVKTFEEELSGRVSFVLDCGHAGDIHLLDNCLRAAASLMFAALDSGHHVEWIDLTHLQANLAPPMSRGDEILDALARITLDVNCMSFSRLNMALGMVSSRSAIHIMLTAWHEAVNHAIEDLLHRNRRVSIYAPEGTRLPKIDVVPVFYYTQHSMSYGV